MSKTLYSSSGAQIQIGRELGKGGEGSVYEVSQFPNLVAKIYHKDKLPDPKKQTKLSFMATSADQQLFNYIAWPQETLHIHPGGPLIGFLMAKVTGRDPIHTVYSPAHRRQERPKAAWDFLLFVARNTASAFDTLHSHGHVLGDVNQGNILVGADSKVVLIDSDSFQINAKGDIHLCEVGVAHFTPPELQGLASFDSYIRTSNHDNFGLALLIFHLLFGGRHPYSGVPLSHGIGDSLESNIKSYRYAYARDAKMRGIAPPPRSIPINIVPENMEAMLNLAFNENEVRGRPSAKQWVTALDSLRSKLKKCGASAMHLYPDHLSKCPWCSLEQEGVVYFVDLGTIYSPTGTGFVLARAWAMIESVSPPVAINIPNVQSITVTPKPLPPEIPGTGTIGFYKLVAVGVAIGIFTLAPGAFIFALIAGFIGWGLANSAGAGPREEERTRRKTARDTALQEFNTLVERVKREAGPEGFLAKKAAYRKLYEEYNQLPTLQQQELQKLHSTAQERQKQKFLDKHFIDQATIPGVGPARKTTLRSFGIETAADVSRNRIRQIYGFGDSLTRAILDWKASIERKFVFNPNNAVSEADKNAVLSKIASRKVAIEGTLNSANSELNKFKQQASSKAASLSTQLQQAAKTLAQANSDLSLL